VSESELEATAQVAVVIPTRSRPDRLARCLTALEAARERSAFRVYVCDSSPAPSEVEAVAAVVERYPWAELHLHDGANVAAARNACARAAAEPLLVSVDDDIEVEPPAIERLVARYHSVTGRRVVSGSVSWDGVWTEPMVMRPIGYSRLPRPGEEPSFVQGAFFLYPRAFALAWPWNERIRAKDDIFMGAVWRAKGVRMLFEPEARALHPELPLAFHPDRIGERALDQDSHIYALLFDALIANPNGARALTYETLGFLASAKLYFRRPSWAVRFLRNWVGGHRALLADRRYLRALLAREPALDAVFAASDLMAVGALRALREAGRHVPGDVAVVGFDDAPLAGHTVPPLTTIRQPLDEMTRRTADLLFAQIRSEPSGRNVICPTELVVRQTT
jgi:glycosyltransferase involved in cell wall biosynthesis